MDMDKPRFALLLCLVVCLASLGEAKLKGEEPTLWGRVKGIFGFGNNEVKEEKKTTPPPPKETNDDDVTYDYPHYPFGMMGGDWPAYYDNAPEDRKRELRRRRAAYHPGAFGGRGHPMPPRN